MSTDETKVAKLHARLCEASRMLDDCAQLIRLCSLGSVTENVKRIGEAISIIGYIDQQVCEVDPGLLPAFFKINEEHSGTPIAQVIRQAYYFEREGQLLDAVELLRGFLDSGHSTDGNHLDIANAELARLLRIHEAQQVGDGDA